MSAAKQKGADEEDTSDHLTEYSGPLTGIKVLDFSGLLPGPYASTILVELGAEVTRVEAPSRPDLVRALPPLIDGYSAAHLSLNRGKRSVAINLKTAEGSALARQLAQQSDVVLEQFRPGVMDRLGLGFSTLIELNPSLIYCSITGYGQFGPLAHRAGHDINYLALAGVSSYSGRAGEGPRLSGVQIADLAGGAQPAVIGILAALLERQRTGRGKHIDLSMSDGALALNALTASAASHQKQSPEYGGTFLNSGTLYDYYETSDGAYLAVGSLEPQFATRLLEVIEATEMTGELLKTPGTQGELRKVIAERIAQRSLAEWESAFASVDCCVEPVLSLNDAMAHPHFEARGMVRTRSTDNGDEVSYVTSPLSVSFSSPDLPLGRAVGADTDQVLAELGLSPEERKQLEVSGVIKRSNRI